MSEKAKDILMNVYECYNNGEDYSVKTPVSSQIHSFNMVLNEIKNYIIFTERSMTKISMTLSDDGIEYCLNNFL